MVRPQNPKPFKTRLNSGFMGGDVIPKPRVHTPSIDNGGAVSFEVQRKIRATLLSGKHPQLATIARENGVTRDYVQRMLDNDPELAASVRTAMAITAEQIEQAAVDMCLDDGVNPIAREKMIEFCLPKMMPEKYGEQASLLGAGQAVRRIALVPVMPVIAVDENGIPIQQSKEAQGKVIDVEAKDS